MRYLVSRLWLRISGLPTEIVNKLILEKVLLEAEKALCLVTSDISKNEKELFALAHFLAALFKTGRQKLDFLVNYYIADFVQIEVKK